MAFQYNLEAKKQKKMIIVLVLVVILTAAVIWFGFFSGSSKPLMPSIINQSNPAAGVSFGKAVVIDFPLLDSQEVVNLKPFDEIPQYAGQVGRDNPFIPY